MNSNFTFNRKPLKYFATIFASVLLKSNLLRLQKNLHALMLLKKAWRGVLKIETWGRWAQNHFMMALFIFNWVVYLKRVFLEETLLICILNGRIIETTVVRNGKTFSFFWNLCKYLKASEICIVPSRQLLVPS